MPSDSSAEHWKIKVEQWKFCYWGFLLLLSPPPPSKIHQWHGALCKCSTILFHAKKLPWGLRWGWSWCQKRPVQVIKLPAGEGNAFIRSVSEHGSEVLSPLVLALKPEAARLVWVFSELLYGLLLVAREPSHLSATDSAVGSVLFLQQFGQYFTSLVSLQEGIILRTPEVIQFQHKHLKPWVYLSFLGGLGRGYSACKKFLVWLQTNQGTRNPLHFSGLRIVPFRQLKADIFS